MDTGRGTKSGSQQWPRAEVQKVAFSNGHRQRYKKWQPAMDRDKGAKSGSQQWTRAGLLKVAASNRHRKRVLKVAASNGQGQGY